MHVLVLQIEGKIFKLISFFYEMYVYIKMAFMNFLFALVKVYEVTIAIYFTRVYRV